MSRTAEFIVKFTRQDVINRAMLQLLKRLEWAGVSASHKTMVVSHNWDESSKEVVVCCLACGNKKRDGHTETCELVALMVTLEVSLEDGDQ